MVNALSRRSQIMKIPVIIYWKYDLKIKFYEALKVHNHYLQVVAMLQVGNRSLKFSKYALSKDGILHFDDEIYVPVERDWKNIIFLKMHNVPYVGHRGYPNMLTTIKKEYY